MELFDEGLLDTLKGIVGIGEKSSEFMLLPKEEWESLMRDNAQLVQLLANTLDIKDAARLVSDVLEQVGSLTAKKIQQQIRQYGVKLRNPNTPKSDRDIILQKLREIIVGLHNEADKIRTVRGGSIRHVESIEEIASIVSEDITINNGILI